MVKTIGLDNILAIVLRACAPEQVVPSDVPFYTTGISWLEK